MQSHQSFNTENKISDNNVFTENREKIKLFFDNNRLKNAIGEFYRVQLNFHFNMANMVNAFTKAKNKLSVEQEYLLTELLAPYRILINNPFDEPTGDDEKDFLHIMTVINKQNEQFKNALLAILNSVCNLESFNGFLKQCQQDEQLVNYIKEQLNCKSWLNVQGSVDHPFQNLIKYELLVKAILKSLVEGGCTPTENILKNLNESLDYLVPEITHINDNKEIIVLLNKIHRVLESLLADVLLKKKVSSQEKTDPISLKERLEFVLVCVQTGKNKVIQNSQDICSLYQGLLELLKDIESRALTLETQSKYTLSTVTKYAVSTSYYMLSLPWLLFGAQDSQNFKRLNPLSDLQKIINELEQTLEQTEALKDVHEKLLRRK